MKSRRIREHPILGPLKDKGEITFSFDGEKYIGYEGDTIASALLANGIRTLRRHEESGTPRGIYCNIGHCYECRVTVAKNPGIRACLTPITEGMIIESGQIQENPLRKSDTKDDFPRTYAQYLQTKQPKSEEDPNV